MLYLWKYRGAVCLGISPTGWSRRAGIHTAPQEALPPGPWWLTDSLSWYLLGSPAGQHHNNYWWMIPQPIRTQKQRARGGCAPHRLVELLTPILLFSAEVLIWSALMLYWRQAIVDVSAYYYWKASLISWADLNNVPWITMFMNRDVLKCYDCM